MKILCIEKSDKFNIIKKMFNKVSLYQNKIILHYDFIKIKDKIKIVKKIKKILLREKVDKVILCNNIKEDKELINLMNSDNIIIANDRWLFKMLINKVIDKIINIDNKSETEIWITVNEIDNIVKNIIIQFAKDFKRVNIITNHIKRFKKIEELLYEDGIIITITNNKRKSLLNAELILNVDFSKEVLNQFAICDKAIIVNLEGNMSIKKKRFCGRIINDIKVESFKDEYIEEFINNNCLQNYDIRDICNILELIPEKLKFNFM